MCLSPVAGCACCAGWQDDPQFSCAEPDEPLFGPLHAYWPTAAFIGTQMAWAAQVRSKVAPACLSTSRPPRG